jgi:hypothetical protein
MEFWVSIPDYDGFYEVSNFGNVRSVTRFVPYGRHQGMIYKGRTLKPFMSGKYLAVKLSVEGVRKTKYIHELALLGFEGVKPKVEGRCEIRHLDGNKFNNTLNNLKYGTTRENAADRKLHAQGLVAVK